TKIVLTAAVLMALCGFTAAATVASFTAETTNPTNKFATGTLVLSNKVNSGTACLSTAGGTTDTNTHGACDTPFSLTVKQPRHPHHRLCQRPDNRQPPGRQRHRLLQRRRQDALHRRQHLPRPPGQHRLHLAPRPVDGRTRRRHRLDPQLRTRRARLRWSRALW